MNIYILSLFPKMFDAILNESILKRAQEKNLVKINIFNLRDWAEDKHKTVDDKAYGGGAGMILKVDVIDKALICLKSKIKSQKSKIILMDPRGKIFNQAGARQLSKIDNLIIICGHYGGVDERVLELVDESVSVGDFVLTGGEIPAMAITDAVVRLIPNVIKKESLQKETHQFDGYKQYAQYTRPEIYKPISINSKNFLKVPNVLLGGNHAAIEKWRNR